MDDTVKTTDFMQVIDDKKEVIENKYLVVVKLTDKQMKDRQGNRVNWQEPVEVEAQSPEEARVMALALAFRTWIPALYNADVVSCVERE